MKNYLLIAIGLMLTACGALAQGIASYDYGTMPFTSPTGVTNQLTTGTVVVFGTNGWTLGRLKFQNVAFSSTIGVTAAGGTNIYNFATSVDGINFDTNTVVSFTNASLVAAGAGTYTAVRSANIGGIGYLKLYSIQTTASSSAAFVTNVAAAFSVKVSSP